MKKILIIGIIALFLFSGCGKQIKYDNNNEYIVTPMQSLRDSNDFGYRISERISNDLSKACYISYIDGKYNSYCELYNKSSEIIISIEETYK